MGFYGEVGMFTELPLPQEISNYEKYTNLKYKDEIEEVITKKDENGNDLMFTM